MGNLRDSRSTSPKAIIFDWDDTICPSSFFDRQQIEKMDELSQRVSARPTMPIDDELMGTGGRCFAPLSTATTIALNDLSPLSLSLSSFATVPQALWRDCTGCRKVPSRGVQIRGGKAIRRRRRLVGCWIVEITDAWFACTVASLASQEPRSGLFVWPWSRSRS